MSEGRLSDNSPLGPKNTAAEYSPSSRIVTLEKPCELPVRESNKISVNFTPRVFPTPERESTKHEEEEVSLAEFSYSSMCFSPRTHQPVDCGISYLHQIG